MGPIRQPGKSVFEKFRKNYTNNFLILFNINYRSNKINVFTKIF